MYYVLIGDMVKSREQKDRRRVQEKFAAILADLNSTYKEELQTNLTITLGDEFQGVFLKGKKILDFVVKFIYEMQPVNFRFGLGYGEISTALVSLETKVLDGPAFYKAREGLEEAKSKGHFLVFKGWTPKEEETFNLISRIFFNQLHRLTYKQLTAVNLMLEETSQKDVAQVLSLSKSAVSQRLKSAHWEDLQATKKWLVKKLSKEDS